MPSIAVSICLALVVAVGRCIDVVEEPVLEDLQILVAHLQDLVGEDLVAEVLLRKIVILHDHIVDGLDEFG